MDGRIIRTFVIGLLIACVITLLGIYQVWQNYRVVQLGGDLGKATRMLNRLQNEHELLEGEYQSLRSRPELVQKARTELRMKLPTQQETIVVTDSKAGTTQRAAEDRP